MKNHEVRDSVNSNYDTMQRFTEWELNRKQFGERIELLLKEAKEQGINQTKVAESAGISEGVLRLWKNGNGNPNLENLFSLAGAMGVTMEWLVCGRGTMRPRQAESTQPTSFDDEYAQVPIYNVSVSAGDGALVEHEEAVGRLAFGRWWLRQAGLQEQHLAAIRATGDSMEPTISDGDMLLVDTSQRDIHADAVFVVRLDDMLVVKRVQRLPGQQVRILSDNRRYDPIQLGAGELVVAGRVVWVGHSL